LLVDGIRVETIEVGLSVRDHVKWRAKVHVTYTFEAPHEEHPNMDTEAA
jgi:hypothetical protein